MVHLPGLLFACIRALVFYIHDISFKSVKTSFNDTPKSLPSEKAGTLKMSFLQFHHSIGLFFSVADFKNLTG